MISPHKLFISYRKWYFSDKNSYKMDWPDQLLANNGANMQKNVMISTIEDQGSGMWKIDYSPNKTSLNHKN